MKKTKIKSTSQFSKNIEIKSAFLGEIDHSVLMYDKESIDNISSNLSNDYTEKNTLLSNEIFTKINSLLSNHNTDFNNLSNLIAKNIDFIQAISVDLSDDISNIVDFNNKISTLNKNLDELSDLHNLEIETLEKDISALSDSIEINTTNISRHINLSATNNDDVHGIRTYVADVISSLGTIFKYMGSVSSYSDLSDITDLNPGDVYNVIDTGMNYVYDISNNWDPLGITINPEEINNKISTLSNELSITSTNLKIVSAEISAIQTGSEPLFTEWKNSETIAAGLNANATNNNIAIGYNSGATGNNAVAVGSSAKANANNNVAIGYNSDADGYNTVALGNNAYAGYENSIAIGGSSNANGSYAVAIGQRAVSKKAGAIQLGSGTVQEAGILQFKDYPLVSSNGQIYHDRISDVYDNINKINSNINSLSNSINNSNISIDNLYNTVNELSDNIYTEIVDINCLFADISNAVDELKDVIIPELSDSIMKILDNEISSVSENIIELSNNIDNSIETYVNNRITDNSDSGLVTNKILNEKLNIESITYEISSDSQIVDIIPNVAHLIKIKTANITANLQLPFYSYVDRNNQTHNLKPYENILVMIENNTNESEIKYNLLTDDTTTTLIYTESGMLSNTINGYSAALIKAEYNKPFWFTHHHAFKRITDNKLTIIFSGENQQEGHTLKQFSEGFSINANTESKFIFKFDDLTTISYNDMTETLDTKWNSLYNNTCRLLGWTMTKTFAGTDPEYKADRTFEYDISYSGKIITFYPIYEIDEIDITDKSISENVKGSKTVSGTVDLRNSSIFGTNTDFIFNAKTKWQIVGGNNGAGFLKANWNGQTLQTLYSGSIDADITYTDKNHEYLYFASRSSDDNIRQLDMNCGYTSADKRGIFTITVYSIKVGYNEYNKPDFNSVHASW